METGPKGAAMADETQDEIQRRLLKLHGRMTAFAAAHLGFFESALALLLS